MNAMTLSPALGWPAGAAISVIMAALAILAAVVHARRKRSSDETLLACIRRMALCLVIAVMALTPSVPQATTSRAVQATDVVVALDVTGSMAVKDAQYGSPATMTRLDAARHAVADLTASYANSSFAAIRFGVSGTLDVPLTPDTLAIRNWANTLETEPTSISTGSRLDAPVDQLLTTLKTIRDGHPDDAIVLYLITDGEQTSPKARRTYSSLRRYLDDAYTLGVGSAKGGAIPLIRPGDMQNSTSGQWVEDPATGKPGVSRMDEKNLRAIADELGGENIILGARQTMADSVSSKASQRWKTTAGDDQRERLTPVVWPLAISAAALLAWELGAWLLMTRRML
ncbi:vWA domain-containing protein [Bifidobacterium sp.]|uniref:vWA domain-containing protein n=1 Tax=Bifidobacterium sp. TaxID=41200 RepID=UPI0025B8A4F0|nr:vWA domain-containing protein [Bifidobacterium sp.]MCH4208671.1 VWA domain-containing protein [Bifidobacterium sp.]MCI1224357.1 VWA domain-containing protein [Bifidobacterium sp.]